MKNTVHPIFQVFLIGILSICLSCEKLIDVELPANQIPSETVFENARTADAALAGIYAGLWNNSPLSGDQLGLLLSLYTDDLDFYATASTDGTMEVYSNQLIASNPVVYGQWASAYQLIYSCNAIMEGCERSISIGTEDKARIKGEALFIRSLLLFYLEQIFGDIPYPVTTNYVINQFISRTPADKVLEILESDVNSSVDLLSDQYRSTERIYVNKKTAQLLLVKVHMAMQKWDRAERELKILIQSPLYKVQNDLSKTFKKTSTNIIWQLKPTNNGDAVKEVLAYYFDYIPPYNCALSNSLVNSFSVSDLRKQFWMQPVTVDDTTWYRAVKYKNFVNNNDEYSVVFRIEEAYLLLTEVLTMQNRISEALPYLNAIRLRAGLSEVTSPLTQAELMDEILSEDRKEFFTETGHRFFDLKRMEKLNLLISEKSNWKPQYKLWPVPEKELLVNPNLNPQNEGY